MIQRRSQRSATCPAASMKKIPGANIANRPRASGERVIWYTCHATAIDCASAPRITSSRAAWYSRSRAKERRYPGLPAPPHSDFPPYPPMVSYFRRRSQIALPAQVLLILGLHHAGIARQVELGPVELELGGDQPALRRRQRRLRLDHRQIVVHAGSEPVARVLERLSGQVHIAPRHLHQFGGRLHIQPAGPDLRVDRHPQRLDLVLHADLLRRRHLGLAAEPALFKDRNLQHALRRKTTVVSTTRFAQHAVVSVEGQRRHALVLHRLARPLR